VSDGPLQDNKHLENFGLTLQTRNLNVGSLRARSDLNLGHSLSESNVHHLNPVEIRRFPKA
jgi:hypothetical protein